jgi:DNA-binding NtrC family response regulator
MEKNNARILIADDEDSICKMISRLLESEGFEALVAHDGCTALKMVRSEFPEVVLSDIRMPGLDGIRLIEKVKELDSDLPVIIITAYADIHGAVEAMRKGAYDYLAKPFEHSEMIRIVRRAVAERELKLKINYLSNHIKENHSLSKMMGPSDAIGRLISDVIRVAESDFTVVILGETGSGKELVARAIHYASNNSGGPFEAIDCGAIPEALLENELFGHEKGAFTGAERQKPGKFEVARAGTLLLDEISNMPLGSQAGLLRILQEKKVYRVGGTKPYDVNVRLLVASNEDLETATLSGTFRQDLFYRLNEFTINIPPLRERKEDIPYLANRFMNDTTIELGKKVKGFSESAMKALIAYDWPGNVRELRATVRRAVLLADEIITEDHLNMKPNPVRNRFFRKNVQEMPWKGLTFKEIVRGNSIIVEREVLIEALKYTGGNKAKAARMLHVDYKTIHTKIKQLGISIKGGKDGEKREYRDGWFERNI